MSRDSQGTPQGAQASYSRLHPEHRSSTNPESGVDSAPAPLLSALFPTLGQVGGLWEQRRPQVTGLSAAQEEPRKQPLSLFSGQTHLPQKAELGPGG